LGGFIQGRGVACALVGVGRPRFEFTPGGVLFGPGEVRATVALPGGSSKQVGFLTDPGARRRCDLEGRRGQGQQVELRPLGVGSHPEASGDGRLVLHPVQRNQRPVSAGLGETRSDVPVLICSGVPADAERRDGPTLELVQSDETSGTEPTPPLLSAHLGGSWQMIYDGDNAVFSDGSRVAKVAKHPDGAARLANGVEATLAADAAGVPVVAPLLGYVLSTDAGPVSLWPLMEHRAPTEIGAEDWARLGVALARLSLVECAPTSWNPLSSVEHRLVTTKAPAALVERARRVVAAMGECRFPPADCATFAHGDISTANTLFTETAALLIDLDSAGPRPTGWDLACLEAHLVKEGGNDAAFSGVVAGWSTVAPVPPNDDRLVALKAFMATTFQFTFPPEPARLERISKRLAAIEHWIAGGSLHRFPPGR
jgi:Ser/Thr protein kinase RdoA (MazF antagonist)